jgi:hypothetical protein
MFMNQKSGTAAFYGGDKYSDAGGKSHGINDNVVHRWR